MFAFLAYVHFLLYFGHCLGESYRPYFLRMITNSPVATFAKCRPYFSSLAIICKNGLHLIIRYSSSHSQANLNE
jgi:hypothetical protein